MSTIDPGIGEPVKEASKDVEGEFSSDSAAQPDRDDGGGDDSPEDDLMYPSTWWFASTACPLLAGTFGPIASGFNICALVYNWRVYIPPGGTESTGEKITDPHWLVAINAVSLFFALIGNATLLLNMARRLKFSVAQPITISGFLLGGVMLVADLAAINSSPTYFITEPKAIPDVAHALTSAYYYAIWAAAIYMIIGFLMCVTVYGAEKGYYDKDFKLTASQRTLMLQTMAFMTYLLLGALVFSRIEGWEYLDAVYWADVTLLTVGLGDFHPTTNVARGLLFPFAIGGVLIIGLVVGSIRSLVLERGKEKMSARITEKRRESAVENVDVRHQTIKVSWFARAEFSTDPSLSPAQRREEEFKVMRKVQRAAERERRYFALFLSASFALILWFVGAAIFMVCEKEQGWTYFQSLYFSFVVLMTIGYGDFTPNSTSGRSFFVIWSLLAVPSLTILISNMGDTIVKWFSDFTIWIGSLTVLPGEGGIRESFAAFVHHSSQTAKRVVSLYTPAGIFGDFSRSPEKDRLDTDDKERHDRILDHVAGRLEYHLEQQELQEAKEAEAAGDDVQRDMHFYHYVLARELRIVQKDLGASPAKKYSWTDWEYFLRLMGNVEDSGNSSGQSRPDDLIPDPLKASQPLESPMDDSSTSAHREELGSVGSQGDRKSKSPPNRNKKQVESWSWLSEKSPLMGSKSEAEWIFERLSAALERELNRQRKGHKRRPPVSMKDVMRNRNVDRVEHADLSSADTKSDTRGAETKEKAKDEV